MEILYSVYGTSKDSGTRTFTLTRAGIATATVSTHEKVSTNSYAYVYFNGIQCARDRMVYDDSATHKYASASCTRLLPPGTYSMRTLATPADDAQWYIDVAQF